MDSTLQDINSPTDINLDHNQSNITSEEFATEITINNVTDLDSETQTQNISGRACFMPNCKNTETSDKILFEVPEKCREDCMKAAGVEHSPPGILYVCQDHTIQTDPVNYDVWKRKKCTPQLNTNILTFSEALPVEVSECLKPQPFKKRKTASENNNCPEQVILIPEIIMNENWTDIKEVTIQEINTNVAKNEVIIQQDIQNEDMESSSVIIDSLTSKVIEVPTDNQTSLHTEERIIKDIPQVDETDKDLTGRKFLLTNIDINPIFYLGVPEHAYWIIEHISNNEPHVKLSVIITLFKIKTDDVLIRLSDEFQLSYDILQQMYKKTVIPLANYLTPLIHWPSNPEKNTQSIRFLNENKEFVNIQCILDCFEIEIDKPLDPKRVIPIWSTERKCPTMKYLIAATPDGIISFVSRGYRGGMSDAHMLTTSGFLDVVPRNCTVLTNRTYRGIEKDLSHKAVTLICLPPENHQTYPPPSPTKGAVTLANLKAPVERIIRKVREFKHLAPHSVVNDYFSRYLDKAVLIACGLINLQSCELSKQFKESKMGAPVVVRKM